jgi:hypothetical protein
MGFLAKAGHGRGLDLGRKGSGDACGVVQGLGSGSGRGGMSPEKIGFRPGASGQSSSMRRSKKMRIICKRWRWVFFDMVGLLVPGQPVVGQV